MKILYLTPKRLYTKKMSSVRRHAVGAIKRHPGVNLKISGPGWDGFDGARKVERRFKPDIVVAYKPLDTPGYENIKSPRSIFYNECWSKEWTAMEIRKSKSGLVICHHHNDIRRFDKILDPKKYKLVHNPHCGEKTIFKDYGLPKDIDVLFVGSAAKKFYPLRYKLIHEVQPILKSKGYGFQVFKHPGYKMKNLKAIKAHTIKYAQAINRARIVVTDSSIYSYALAKYVEIPLCKSALCGDLPGENQEWFKGWMIVISQSDTPEKIASKIIGYLSNKEDLERKTKMGHSENLELRTQEDYATRFIGLATDYLNGDMGNYDFSKNSERYYNGGEHVYY